MGRGTAARRQGHISGSRDRLTWGLSDFVSCAVDLEPPEFEIAGFTDHIHVTLEFPPTLPKGPTGQGPWSHLSLVIEEQLEGIVKEVSGQNQF